MDNKISFKELLGDVEASYDPTVLVHWHGVDIEIKKQLSMSETIAFVSDVIEASYTSVGSAENGPDDIAMVYAPELKDFAVKYITVAYYTNIDLNADDDTVFDFIFHSDIIDKINDSIDLYQYGKILEAIDEKIKYINDSNIIEITREFARFNEVLNEIGPALTSITETLGSDDMGNMLNELLKIQGNNALKDLAIKEMKPKDVTDAIQFSMREPGEEDDGNN